MSQENTVTCQHPTEKSSYLTTYEQTHLEDPDTKAMLACLFLCAECGKIYAANVEVIRGRNPDGTIPEALAKYIEKRKENIDLELRAHRIAARMTQDKETRHDN